MVCLLNSWVSFHLCCHVCVWIHYEFVYMCMPLKWWSVVWSFFFLTCCVHYCITPNDQLLLNLPNRPISSLHTLHLTYLTCSNHPWPQIPIRSKNHPSTWLFFTFLASQWSNLVKPSKQLLYQAIHTLGDLCDMSKLSFPSKSHQTSISPFNLPNFTLSSIQIAICHKSPKQSM